MSWHQGIHLRRPLFEVHGWIHASGTWGWGMELPWAGLAGQQSIRRKQLEWLLQAAHVRLAAGGRCPLPQGGVRGMGTSQGYLGKSVHGRALNPQLGGGLGPDHGGKPVKVSEQSWP